MTKLCQESIIQLVTCISVTKILLFLVWLPYLVPTIGTYAITPIRTMLLHQLGNINFDKKKVNMQFTP